MEIVYCAGGNKRFAQIAIDAGFLYGARLPSGSVHHPIYFADQNWKKPDRTSYIDALKLHRPEVATVLDLEKESQLPEVLGWAEDAATIARRIIIIPKSFGIIPSIPRRVAGSEVILGYSVPTSHGGTELPVWEFEGWPVHLLGGSPQAQMRITHYLNVVSTDGNMAMKMATRRCQFWTNGTAFYAQDRHWPKLHEADERMWGKDAPYEAFRRSCENIAQAWKEHSNARCC